MRRLIALFFVAALVAAACGNDDTTNADGSSTTSTTRSTSTTADESADADDDESDDDTSGRDDEQASSSGDGRGAGRDGDNDTGTVDDADGDDDGIPAADDELVMSPRAIGAASFGDPIDEVQPYLGLIIGPATEDSGWIDSFSGFGTCPGQTIRVLDWAGELLLFFTDGETFFGAEGTDHLFHFEYYGGDLGLRTADGFGVGDLIEDALAAWGPDGEWVPATAADEEEAEDPFATQAAAFLHDGDVSLQANAPAGSMDTDVPIVSFWAGQSCGE